MPKRIAFIAVLLLAALCGAPSHAADEQAEKTQTLVYFHSPGCHRCIATRAEIMPLIEEKYRGRVTVDYRDIEDVENYKMLFALKKDLGADEKSVFPVLYFGGKFLDGRDEHNLTYTAIAAFIESYLDREVTKVAAATESDILTYFRQIRPVALAVAGIVDGINPCAFTVIVFFISFLFFQNYDKKKIAIIGFAFMLSVFTTYVMIGLGLFSWLRAMKTFQFFTGAVNIAIALLAIVLGVAALYDAIVFRKKGNTDEMILQLPKYLKGRIHSIIGSQYRVKKGSDGKTSPVALFISALVVGFLVSIFESVCTGQMYLPTIMFIFKTTEHKLPAFGYLVFYNIMFMVPLIAVYLMAMVGVTSEKFSMALKNNMFLIKLFMAGLFFFLGLSLLYAAEPARTVVADTAAVAAAQTSSGGATAQGDPNFYDFGKVKEGAVLKHTFILKNVSMAPFNITEVNTSCACASSDLEIERLEPGQEVPVELAFDTRGYPGIRKRQLFIHTDAPQNPLIIFEVQAEVEKSCDDNG